MSPLLLYVYMKIFYTLTTSLVMAVVLTSCQTPYQPVADRNAELTQGNVQMTLSVGSTTKATVLEKFGAPNITTRDGAGREVWTYQRAGQVSQAETSSSGWTVILAGSSRSQSGFESGSRCLEDQVSRHTSFSFLFYALKIDIRKRVNLLKKQKGQAENKLID